MSNTTSVAMPITWRVVTEECHGGMCNAWEHWIVKPDWCSRAHCEEADNSQYYQKYDGKNQANVHIDARLWAWYPAPSGWDCHRNTNCTVPQERCISCINCGIYNMVTNGSDVQECSTGHIKHIFMAVSWRLHSQFLHISPNNTQTHTRENKHDNYCKSGDLTMTLALQIQKLVRLIQMFLYTFTLCGINYI